MALLDADAVREFAQAAHKAQDILYLTDNAGEIVFDRLLIEQLPMDRITVAVKGSPIINDATRVDAETVGLTNMVSVIDNGSDAPGTMLEDCSRAFRDRFDRADLVVAKGQGNYETLSEVDKNIVFILKVKCPVIAGILTVTLVTWCCGIIAARGHSNIRRPLMPRGDGTGPMGQGPKTGQGQKLGVNKGRMGGPYAAGPGGDCVCPSCGEKLAHMAGQPCNQRKCPKCGSAMTRG